MPFSFTNTPGKSVSEGRIDCIPSDKRRSQTNVLLIILVPHLCKINVTCVVLDRENLGNFGNYCKNLSSVQRS